ncbi:MAG: hypothetical protein BJ554DRAFT_2832 [Olpidium bornovanus]|uniref:Uncharacterized protein n=1 Tax=Olpidium bornovanus TaxID=278681 RepID=A0A8H7ZPX1_9FUNG|nr:MAG: hypothetical protein BJ554DRAFT_2832 [Olpidium bornovanus]
MQKKRSVYSIPWQPHEFKKNSPTTLLQTNANPAAVRDQPEALGGFRESARDRDVTRRCPRHFRLRERPRSCALIVRGASEEVKVHVALLLGRVGSRGFDPHERHLAGEHFVVIPVRPLLPLIAPSNVVAEHVVFERAEKVFRVDDQDFGAGLSKAEAFQQAGPNAVRLDGMAWIEDVLEVAQLGIHVVEVAVARDQAGLQDLQDSIQHPRG